jgi:uncharacterized protein (DUF1800 family)
MNRREFFTSAAPKSDGVEQLTHVKGLTRRTSTGITEYTGTWSKWEVKHILSRALVGYTHADLTNYTAKTMVQTVDALLNIDTAIPPLPTNDYSYNTPDPTCAEDDIWVTKANANNFQRRMSLRNWWMRLMIQDGTIREKLTLFWHNHFAAESNTIADARSVYTYQAALRKNCLGNFKSMTKDITLDPGMLRYLNGFLNANAAPDENYGRELQELFTVGKGPDSKYTEDDVKAAARVLTGWRIDTQSPPKSYFQESRHDKNDKVFSSFYGNTTITGQTGATGGEIELDNMLNMIFAQNEVAKHVVRRLYKFFVYYDIDAGIETDVIEPLANIFRNNNYDIKPVIETLLKSEHFFDQANRGCIIKQPIDYLIGFAKSNYLNVPLGTQSNEIKYIHQKYLMDVMAISEQNLLDPPSVAGWPAYYQIPSFYELWVTSNTMPIRVGMMASFITSGFNRAGYAMKMNVFDIAEKVSDPSDPNKVVKECLEYYLSMPHSTALFESTKEFLLPGGLPDFNWTNIWNTYKSNPGDAANTKTCTDLLTYMLYSILNLAEYQLH